MNSETDDHLSRLRSIVHAPIDVTESGQFHRFYWMGETQLPTILKDEVHSVKKLRTDYSSSCHDVRKYWKTLASKIDCSVKECSTMNSGSSCRASSMFSMITPDYARMATWKMFCKRDTVSGILKDPMTDIPASLYRDSYTKRECTGDFRGFHIQGNPITKFGEALFLQKNVIR